MAAPSPSQLISGYVHLAAAAAAPSEGIFIPLANLSGVNAAALDPANGDGRLILLALDKNILAAYTALGTKPTHLTVARATPTGVDNATVRQTYSKAFDLDITTDNTLIPEA